MEERFREEPEQDTRQSKDSREKHVGKVARTKKQKQTGPLGSREAWLSQQD